MIILISIFLHRMVNLCAHMSGSSVYILWAAESVGGPPAERPPNMSSQVGKTNKLLNILSGLSQQHTPDHLRAQVLSISTMPRSSWGAALIIGLGMVISVVTISKDFAEISLDIVWYNSIVHSFTEWTLSHFWVCNEEMNYNRINVYRD